MNKLLAASLLCLICMVAIAGVAHAQSTYPAQVDSDFSLPRTADNTVTYLTAAITTATTIIPVNDTSGFPNASIIQIGNEWIFVEKTGGTTQFLTITRPFGGTLVAAHPAKAIVRAIFASANINPGLDAITELEKKLGSGASLAAGQPAGFFLRATGASLPFTNYSEWSAIQMSDLGTGTPSSSNFLRGDGSWQAIAPGLTGSGTPGKLAKWTGSTALGDSLISESGSIVTINSSSIAMPANFSMGNSASAGGTSALALGFNANATGNYSIAQGWATSGGSQSIAIGLFSSSAGSDSVAIGSIANASASGAIAIGINSTSSVANCIALGNAATCNQASSAAIGAGVTLAANEFAWGSVNGFWATASYRLTGHSDIQPRSIAILNSYWASTASDATRKGGFNLKINDSGSAATGREAFRAESNGTHALVGLAGSSVTTTTDVTIQAQAASYLPLLIKGAASQSGNLTEWQNSSATVLAKVDKDGHMFVPDVAYGSGWNGDTSVPTKNAVYDKIESLPIIASGFYTPTSSGEDNVTSNTPTEAQWMRVGNVVTVSGRFYIQIGSVITPTFFEFDLPIASTITSDHYVAGVCYDAAVLTSGGEVYGNVSNNTAQFRIVVRDDGSALDAPYSYTFTYRIN